MKIVIIFGYIIANESIIGPINGDMGEYKSKYSENLVPTVKSYTIGGDNWAYFYLVWLMKDWILIIEKACVADNLS